MISHQALDCSQLRDGRVQVGLGGVQRCPVGPHILPVFGGRHDQLQLLLNIRLYLGQ